MATEIQSLDLSRLLLAHAGLSLVAALSNSPIWNFPLALYGLVVVGKSESSDGGDSVRQFSGLLALSFIFDFFWQTSSETNGFCRFLLLVNWCLKPITLLAALGHLRQRGQPTFAFPGGISLPTNFSLPGGYPGGGQSQTVWNAQQESGYQPAPTYQQQPQSYNNQAQQQHQQHQQAPPPPPPHVPASEGQGYHTLE